MVRAEGARLGLAHAAASESHATSALADERRNVERRRSQDDPAPYGYDGRQAEEGDREAHDDPTQDNREAEHRQAQDGETEHRETDHGEACGPQDHRAPQERWAVDREANDPQEAPLIQGWF